MPAACPPPVDLPRLRRHLRQQRRALSVPQQRQAARAVARRLVRHPLWQGCQHIGLYLSAFGEVSLLPLARQLQRRGKRLYLPVVRRWDQRLRFVRTSARQLGTRQRLRRHPLGMQQPALHGSRSVHQLDVLVMPLLGFDAHGHRLGMGGGYYDRTLGQPGRGQCVRPLRLGVAHGFQQVAALPVQPWDQPLHQLVSPQRHWFFHPLRGLPLVISATPTK